MSVLKSMTASKFVKTLWAPMIVAVCKVLPSKMMAEIVQVR